jgi:two-component system cell cycle response regulator DivK
VNNTTVPCPLVLIVDDNPKNLKLARDVLLAAGFRTLQAETGGEALQLAGRHVPDVILLDLRLPDIDGADVARQLARSERTSAIPVVALSSLALDVDADWLRETGFAGSIEKPISVADFPAQVRGYCPG